MNNQTKNNYEHNVSYSQFIAGALLKFNSIDNIDFKLLIDDFESKTNIKVTGTWNNLDTIFKYVRIFNNGSIVLKQSLKSFVEGENCTVEEILQDYASLEVNEYFNNLDLNMYHVDKRKKLTNYRENILKRANILLISDKQESYDELKKYGFENIDYFKSLVRADKYFDGNEEKLSKYHIIITDNDSISRCAFYTKVKLESKIEEYAFEKGIVYIPLKSKSSKKFKVLSTSFTDIKNNKTINSEDRTYYDLCDKIIQFSLINDVFDKVDLSLNFEYKDSVNPNIIVPKNKSGLKVLFLDQFRIKPCLNRISDELGIDLEVMEDNNFTLGNYVKEHLGEYDIIIASNIFSRNILNMNKECSEQCKDSGRQLVLLTTYANKYNGKFDEYGSYDFLGIGSSVDLNYVFCDSSLDETTYKSKFNVLRPSEESETNGEYYASQYSVIKAIIEVSINIYNDALKQNNIGIIDDFKTLEEYDSEYERSLHNLNNASLRLKR